MDLESGRRHLKVGREHRGQVTKPLIQRRRRNALFGVQVATCGVAANRSRGGRRAAAGLIRVPAWVRRRAARSDDEVRRLVERR